MPVAQKSRGLSVRGALFLVAIFGAAALIVSVKGTPHKVELPSDDDLHENVTLSVIFKPLPGKKRTRTVNVQAHVEGVRVVPPVGGPEYLPLLNSPWNHVVRVPKGAQVSLYAFQDEDGSLDCVIMGKDGVRGNPGHRMDMGSIRCFYNRPGS